MKVHEYIRLNPSSVHVFTQFRPRQIRLNGSCKPKSCLGTFCKDWSICKMFTMWYLWRFQKLSELFLDFHSILNQNQSSPPPFPIYFGLWLFASLAGDQKVNSSFSQKVFAYFLENVSLIYQVCQFAYFTRSLRFLSSPLSNFVTSNFVPNPDLWRCFHLKVQFQF